MWNNFLHIIIVNKIITIKRLTTKVKYAIFPNMKFSLLRSIFSFTVLLTLPTSISSCAYTQFNKQIEENATTYNGFAVELPLSLYSSQGNWYVKVRKIDVRKIRPFVHDSIMLDNSRKLTFGTVKPLSYYTDYQYIRISKGTADVLRRTDGYASLETLSDELRSNYSSVVSELPESMQHRVYAEIKTEQGNIAYIAPNGAPIRQPGVGTRILSKLALVCVDFPGTVIYNVSMPIMAPVLFFRDLIIDDDSISNISH